MRIPSPVAPGDGRQFGLQGCQTPDSKKRLGDMTRKTESLEVVFAGIWKFVETRGTPETTNPFALKRHLRHRRVCPKLTQQCLLHRTGRPRTSNDLATVYTEVSHHQNPGDRRVRDNPSHKWVRIAASSILYMGGPFQYRVLILTQVRPKTMLKLSLIRYSEMEGSAPKSYVILGHS